MTTLPIRGGEARLRERLCRTGVPSPLGSLSIVWVEAPEGPRVRRILLPGEGVLAKEELKGADAGIDLPSNSAIRTLAEQIQSCLKGEAVDFQMDLIDLKQCSEFQSSVLLAEYEIPRGWVSTYGRIARSLGVPNAARAVGTALARNPFPIIIPCHRTVRSNGDLGGFGGGLKMKRELLELEGVQFSTTGRVLTDRFYY